MVPRHALLFITALIILLILLSTVRAQYGVDEIPGFGNVPYINLARGARITATATCGEDQFGRPRSELYCKLVGGPTNGPHSQTIEGQFCDVCNSNDPNKAHPVTNAIDGTERWWQSPPLSRGLEYNEVNITLDLGQLYHVAYVLIKFGNSPRPDLWVLERSVDNGRTYTPWQYFAHSRRDCIEKFGKQPNAPIVCDNDQICSTEYSRIVPFENGEIVVSLVNGRPGSRDFARAPLLQEFTKASNIRLRFLRTSTLLGHLISKAQRDPTVTRRYFYSIKDISVGGRSVSYSQAQLPQNPDAGNQERIGEYVNRCVPCSCNGLSNECEEATGKCLNCQYNTAGDRCERCKDGHYGDPARRTCRMCPCPFAVESNNFATGCRQVADGFQCLCKPGYTGDRCERCAPGYYGEPLANGGSCRPCNCNGNDCDQRTGVCNNPVEPEPGDSNMEEQCSECDNCAQELLKDLEKLDEELIRIKGLLERSGTSSAAKQRLKELNELIRKTERLIKEFSSEVNTQEKRVDRMKLEVLNLEDDINSLKQQAEKSSQNAQDAVNKAEDTHQKARDLDNEARDLLKKIQELLKKLKDATTGEVIVPSEDLADLLEKATKMVNEMEARDFAPQKTLAEDEKKEAQKLLDHIRNNVNKQMEENKKAAEKVQGLLDGYKAKLKDLEEKLKEANDLVKTANNQNSINTRSMDDLLKRIKALEQERDKVAGQIDMAKKQLKDTGDLLNMLADSKKEYEELAAQLDGAKKDVIRKLNDISRVEGLKDLVKRAEDHAENLSKLAKELQDAVQSSSGNADVQNAIAAIDAYKNIVDAVNAADEAAKEAKDAAEKALNQVNQEDLTARAKKLKDNANNLLKDAEQGEKDLKLASEDLTDQKKRLEDAKKKKDKLERDHRAVLEGLKDIQRGDTADLIDAAKRAAASAQETNRKTLGRLDTIKDELDKINLKPTDSNIDKVLNEVDKSVKNLSNTIPSLIDKISEIEQLSSELGPSKNVTDNINRIKELIEQARDAANRVVVPMRFEGDGYVELRTPKNLDDLKAYTDLSLTLQRPLSRLDKRSARYSRQATPGNLFVMYLGNRNVPNDYLGMVVKQDVLYFVYKLNGREYEIPTTEITRSATEPAIFDKVDVHRIYQDAEVKYTRSFTSNDPYPAETKTVMGSLGQNLLDLDPNEVVFYVGGYPSNFTPPASLNHPNYKGCIEFSTFNEQDLSLYNFKNAVNINKVTPCKRYTPQEVSDFFEGTGYGKVPFVFSTRSNILSQNVQTRSENGLLLFIGNEESYWSISLDKGYVVVTSKNATSTEPLIQKSTSKYPALSGEVKVAIINQKLTVIVNSNSVITTPFLAGPLDHYYIGGLPQSLRERVSIATLPFKGCVSNVKANNKYMVYMETLGVGKGCPVDLLGSRKAEFSLGCALQSPPGDFSLTGDVSLSLGFRSNKTDGVLFQNSQAGTGIELSMVDGYVVLKYNGIWKSNKQYQDGKWHYLTVTKEGSSMSLRIDEEDEGQKQANSVSLGPEPKDIVLGKDTFKGCLSNLYMRRSLYRPEDLSTFTSSGDILLDVCSA